MPRFNHMELTLPPGALAAQREEIREFFADVFGFDSLDVPIVGQTGLLLRTDADTSQFILVTEQQQSMHSPGYDHLGFLYDTRAEVDLLLEKVKKRQQQDARVQIKEYEDLAAGPVDRERFMTWLRLPRRAAFVREQYRERHATRGDELATARGNAESGLERLDDDGWWATTRTVDYYGYWYYWGWWYGGYYPGWGGGWYPDGTVTYTYHLGSLIWGTFDLRRADSVNRIMPLAWMSVVDGPLDEGAQGITVGTIYGLIDQAFTQSPYIQSGSGAIAVRRPTK